MKLKEIIVVEGRDDTVAIQRAVDADTIETNGSAINEATLKRIALAQERRGVIVFTDPDYPGERIRRVISSRISGCKHAFLPKRDAVSKNKNNNLGVENASPDAIRKALQSVQSEWMEAVETITVSDLHAAGLIGGPLSRKRRERLGERLSIGYANGKTLHKRLQAFQIAQSEFAEALAYVLEEERND